MSNPLDTFATTVRRIANLIAYEVPIDSIRQELNLVDTDFFLLYKAAEHYLKDTRNETVD
jgi:hypothetical protein